MCGCMAADCVLWILQSEALVGEAPFMMTATYLKRDRTIESPTMLLRSCLSLSSTKTLALRHPVI